MTARLGMASPILRLRALTNAGTADYTVAGTAYFTDDQLQTELDRQSSFLSRVRLFSVPTWLNTIFVYYDYIMPSVVPDDFEHNATDGSSKWAVKDGAGNLISISTYTPNYDAKRIVFNADTKNQLYFLDVLVFDMNRAAANVWDMKADFVSSQVDWSTQGNRVNASQEAQFFRDRAKYYRSLSGPHSSQMIRTDENADNTSLTTNTGENRDVWYRPNNDWKY